MHRADVGLVDRHVVGRPAYQSSCQLRITFDGDDATGAPCQQERHRARTRAEIEDEISGLDARSIDEASSDVRPQEVL